MTDANTAAASPSTAFACRRSGERPGTRSTHAIQQAGDRLDAETVIRRLQEAGAALLALPTTGWSTRLRSAALEPVHSAAEAYGWTARQVRPAIPSAEQITQMDEAMGWLQLIPQDRFVLRRVVGARSLVHPITERHLFSWRRLGTALGADHKAVQRWHAQGIDCIVAALARPTTRVG